MNGARKLDAQEYKINPSLGYISLFRKLQNDEVLAVAYEYTYNGQAYKVGELSEDYQNRADKDLIFLKMLRPNKINVEAPTWNLMMKNVYPLGAFPLEPNGFRFEIQYRDDQTGIPSNTLQNAQHGSPP